MPHASAARFYPVFALCQQARQTLPGLLAVGASVAQAVGFAAILWLLMAGPGALADHPSTVPLLAGTSP